VHLCGFGARVSVAAETEGRLWVSAQSLARSKLEKRGQRAGICSGT